VCAILFLVNIRMRGWALPVIAVGLLALVSITAGAAYPAFVQRFSVNPQELQRERPFIENNIEATRRAFGLDTIESRTAPLSGTVSADDVEANEQTIRNIRLWRPSILIDNYAALQRIRAYYEFHDIDVDRYQLEGETRLVMVSAREIAQNEIPGGGSWQNRHLVYTHGFGAVVSQVNTSTSEGQPLFTLRDIPPVGEPLLEGNGPRVYYGENEDVSFVVVDTAADELDYQGTPEDDQEQVTQNYEGQGGIPIGGIPQRALFAWRYRDVNLLISSLVEGDSRIMIYRDIHERAPKAAPFLQFDADPYAAIVDGRLVWIWDAYTTTNEYPYSQPAILDEVATQPEELTFPSLTGPANYLRNSVKVVVDAYDGTITYYVVEPGDPIIQAWQGAFPDLFTPMSEATPDLLAHFRYPENLFQVQAWQFTAYHVTDPTVFYGRQDFWEFPGDPAAAQVDAEQVTTAALPPMRPYYVLMRLPGEQVETFSLILPFTPLARQNMIAWLAAKSDPGEGYGQMISYEFPSGRNVDGPTQVFARINADSQFAAERTLLGQGGSEIRFGDFLVVPIEESLLYVQPVYVQSDQPNAIPELRRVIVVNGPNIGIGSTLGEALADAPGEGVSEPPEDGAEPPPEDGAEPPPEGTADEQVQALLDEAANHFALADAALRNGDLATYQREVELAQAAIEEALSLVGGEAAASPTPSP
jgi:uncharacterized protein